MRPMHKTRRTLELDDGRTTLVAGATLLLIFCLVTSFLEHLHFALFWPAKLVLDMIRDLGIAFIVGGVVSLGIERISRARFQSEIADEIKKIERSAINAAFLKTYPIEYTEEIEKTLRRTKYFKYGLNIIIDIIEPDPPINDAHGNPLIYYEQSVSYQAGNVSGEEQTLKPRLFFDLNPEMPPPELLEWTVGKHELKGEAVSATRAHAEDHGNHRWYHFPIGVPLGAGEKVYVFSKVRNFKYPRDVTTWCGIQPADSMRLVINHPPGYYAYAQPKTAARTTDTSVVSDGRRVVVELFTPLLPYVTIELGWNPKPSTRALAAIERAAENLQEDAPIIM